MKKLIFAFFISTLVLTSFTSSEVKEFQIGDKAPMLDYSMENCFEGSATIESSMNKNGLVVIFSCNTCPFVVGNKGFEGWEKQYGDLYKTAKESGLGFVLINSNEAKRDGDDSMEAMRKHAKEAGYKMPYLVDTNSKLANAFGAKTTPHVYVLNSNFELVYKGSIDNTWDTKRDQDIDYLKPAIKNLVNDREITPSSTTPKGCSIKRV